MFLLNNFFQIFGQKLASKLWQAVESLSSIAYRGFTNKMEEQLRVAAAKTKTLLFSGYYLLVTARPTTIILLRTPILQSTCKQLLL